MTESLANAARGNFGREVAGARGDEVAFGAGEGAEYAVVVGLMGVVGVRAGVGQHFTFTVYFLFRV